jgi:hypothetical protein
MHVKSLRVIIPTIKICLVEFHYNNKIVDKTLPRLGEFNQVIEPFQHGHNTRNAHHYLQITKQLQIMGNLSITTNILIILKTKEQYSDITLLVGNNIEI